MIKVIFSMVNNTSELNDNALRWKLIHGSIRANLKISSQLIV